MERPEGTNQEGASSESPVALVVADFMFGARVQSALSQMGWTPRMAGAPDAALQAIRDSRPRLVLVELGAGNPARIEFIRNLRSQPGLETLPVLAFGSHKVKTALEAARDAGATMVVSNGSLVSRFPDLVRKAVGASLSEEDRFITEGDEA